MEGLSRRGTLAFHFPPIVITTAIDPVGAGLAESLARPGGNVTGVALLTPEISGKALSLLKEAVPTLSRVAVLWNGDNPAFTAVWREVDTTARSMGLVLLSQPVREPQDFAAAFAAVVSQRPEGFFVLVDALVGQYMGQVVEFTIRERLAAMSTFRGFAALGGLMSYGPNITAAQHKAADYVDKVLKGENPRRAAPLARYRRRRGWGDLRPSAYGTPRAMWCARDDRRRHRGIPRSQIPLHGRHRPLINGPRGARSAVSILNPLTRPLRRVGSV